MKPTKHIRSRLLFWLFALAGGIGALSCSESESQTEENQGALTITGPAIADTYVRDGDSAATNFGSAAAVQVKRAGWGENRWAYFKFDTSSVSGTLSSATLRLFGNNSTNTVTIAVYPVAADAWTETGMTWNDHVQPKGGVLASTAVSSAVAWYQWNVTNYVNAERAAGRRTVAFILQSLTWSDGLTTFHSRQASAAQPVLNLATASGGTAGSTGSAGSSGAGNAGSTGSAGSSGSGGSPSGSPMIGACPVLPADNPWNRNIAADPVDANSATYIAAMNGGSAYLHPDFGSDPTYGIPWITVPGTQPKVPMEFDYASDSDPGPYPFPANAPIEGGASSDGDRHILVLDRDTCMLYETWDSHYQGPGWFCGSGAIFNLRSNALRPDGWTSADAAGLPILPGLVRRSEVQAGEIKHALRFTVAKTQKAYVHPATHYASSSTDASLPPLGIRVRLKASYDISRFSANNRVILTAMKQYGMYLADNGSNWYFSGEANTAWDDDEVSALKSVPASAFEVVKLGTIYP